MPLPFAKFIMPFPMIFPRASFPKVTLSILSYLNDKNLFLSLVICMENPLSTYKWLPWFWEYNAILFLLLFLLLIPCLGFFLSLIDLNRLFDFSGSMLSFLMSIVMTIITFKVIDQRRKGIIYSMAIPMGIFKSVVLNPWGLIILIFNMINS